MSAAADSAPRGAALEIAAAEAVERTAAEAPEGNDETTKLKAELQRWVQHCLQMDTALNAAEQRAAELERRHRSRPTTAANSVDGESGDDGTLHSKSGNRPQQHQSCSDSDSIDTPQPTPGSRHRERGERSSSPNQGPWTPAPMSHEVHKALVEQSLLPAGRTPGSIFGREKPGSKPAAAAGPGMIKLLLVEDDPFQADAILSLCEQCGYNAQVAGSASEALELVRAQPEINLVLSDVMMEGASGYDLLVRIRSIRSHVSVIMLSAYESIDLVQQCILSGADAYLLKPLRVHELTNIWQYVWRRRHELQLMQQVSSLSGHSRHGAPMPNLQEATKVKGGRQRLTKDRVPELVEASRNLDKVELVSTRQVERQMREQLRELVLEEPHTAHKPERLAESGGGARGIKDGATSFGTVNGELAPLAEATENSSGVESPRNDDDGGSDRTPTPSPGPPAQGPSPPVLRNRGAQQPPPPAASPKAPSPNPAGSDAPADGLSPLGVRFDEGDEKPHKPPPLRPVPERAPTTGGGGGAAGAASGSAAAAAAAAAPSDVSPAASAAAPAGTTAGAFAADASPHESTDPSERGFAGGSEGGSSNNTSDVCQSPGVTSAGASPRQKTPSAGASPHQQARKRSVGSDRAGSGASSLTHQVLAGAGVLPGLGTRSPSIGGRPQARSPVPASGSKGGVGGGGGGSSKPVAMTICRLCEEPLPKSDLSYHLVHCTAAHSCHDRLRQLDRAMRTFALRIRRRRTRMQSVFERIQQTLRPLDGVLQFLEDATKDATKEGAVGSAAAAGSAPRAARAKAGCVQIDPMDETYKLMNLQRAAEKRFAAIEEPAIAELAVQAIRLANNKMSAYWDLLSLQDPFAPPVVHKPPKANVSIKEYALVEPLGTGGFGTVWLARRRRTGDLSAIKVLSMADTRRKNMSSAVLLEKAILEQADHPCVTKLLFSFSTQKNLYMVMEYLPGGDCFTMLQSYGFLEETLVRWFCAEALLGLQYLHSCAIIHRDVKPSNMLITKDGHIKLADFGLSAEDDRGPASSEDEPAAGEEKGVAPEHPLPLRLRMGHVVGTPDFLAPELLKCSGYSYEVDFWALGVVIFQLLIGETPFEADEPHAVYARILEQASGGFDPPIPDMIENADCADLVTRLLVAEPSQRLGAGTPGESCNAILEHGFFAPIEPSSREQGPLHQRESPFKPTLRHETDTCYFDMNALARAQAERMRSALERDGEEPSQDADDAGGGDGGAGADGADGKGVDGEGKNSNEEVGNESFKSKGEDEDEVLNSFETVNALMLARTQLLETDGADKGDADDGEESDDFGEEEEEEVPAAAVS